MVGKWQVKNPLTLEEREKIKEAIDLNMTYAEMAAYVGRAKTTVRRESNRLGHYSIYDPGKAQKHFEDKQIEKSNKRRVIS